jgi:nitrogen fixation/metabolism regulation signal transduction histidine kinase
LRQIIHNLLRNAEDAQEAGRFSAYHDQHAPLENMAEWSSAIAGQAFRPKSLPVFFEPYVTTKARGTGLGLAIVKKIVDEHHGRIKSTTVSRSAPRSASPAAGSLPTRGIAQANFPPRPDHGANTDRR